MKDLLTAVLGAGAGIAIIVLVFLIGPILVIWTINSLAEAGGAQFYIEHNMWNYWIAFILLLLVRGGSSSNSD